MDIRQQLLAMGFAVNLVQQALLNGLDLDTAQIYILQRQQEDWQDLPDEAPQIKKKQKPTTKADQKEGKTEPPRTKMVIICRSDRKIASHLILEAAAQASIQSFIAAQNITNEVHRTALSYWLAGGNRKVVLKIQGADNLTKIYENGLAEGYAGAIIHVEEEPLLCALGPFWEDGLNKITGKLRLF